MSERITPNGFFYGLDNVVAAGDFFIQLAQHLEDRTLTEGEDLTPLLQEFDLRIPPELADASIVSVEENSSLPERATRLRDEPLEMVITYPPVDSLEAGDAREFKKCAQVCQTKAGVKICAQVCVEVSISGGGIHGSVSATISLNF